MELIANSKLNLTMEILGKRPDNYHEIRTVMQFLEFGDRLVIEPSREFSFWCDDKELENEQNLAVKAFRLMEQRCKVSPVRIELYKHTPVMSGMGGGSADAAAVLRALNKLWGLGLSLQQLAEMGMELGADVPACVFGGLLLAEGMGERITRLDQSRELWFCVIKPDCAFSTSQMYADIDSRGSFVTGCDLRAFLAAARFGDIPAVAAGLCNGFERVAQPASVIEQAKAKLLESGALAASMTGAGSAVFGIYSDEISARAAHVKLCESHQAYLCRSAQPIVLEE